MTLAVACGGKGARLVWGRFGSGSILAVKVVPKTGPSPKGGMVVGPRGRLEDCHRGAAPLYCLRVRWRGRIPCSLGRGPRG